MEKATLNYRLVKKIKDDKFDVDGLHHYNLSIQIGDTDFQVCIADANSNQCLLLEDYILNDVDSSDELIDIISSLFDNHHLLKAGFWSTVKVSLKNPKFTLVPENLFQKESLPDYLKLNCTLDPVKEELNYYKQIKSDAVGVFSGDKNLLDWLRSVYPNITLQVIHQTNALIEGVLSYEDHTDAKSMFIFTDRNNLTIIVAANKKLIYCNKFVYNTTNAFLKYVFTVFQLQELDQHNSKVHIWGNINTQSPQFKELYKYFKQISFGGKPSYLKFNYMFDEAEDHQYFDLYNTFLCQ
ncbi:DUF3822 family protein [Fulvivirgaceae bacterium BMA10]|uniref:DUF3822 family protein n=1 Tax=Splendidivirga corallicola TaxID=3051826 RepID=A0ABT8KL06_9BACT|nr:DUF3822 family protein [Fulvivirgaceae bacterium BMA10]